MARRIRINPNTGDAVLTMLEKQTGERLHLVMIVFPLDGPRLGQPEFVTSLVPDEMEQAIIQVAGGFVLAGKRTVEN